MSKSIDPKDVEIFLLDNPDLRCRLNGLQLFSPNIFIIVCSNLIIKNQIRIWRS